MMRFILFAMLFICLVSAGRPSPAYLTQVIQTAPYKFQLTILPPKYWSSDLSNSDVVQLVYTNQQIGLEVSEDGVNQDTQQLTSTPTSTSTSTSAPPVTYHPMYQLFVVDPNDPDTEPLLLPSQSWKMSTDNEILLDVTSLCTDLNVGIAVPTTSTTTPLTETPTLLDGSADEARPPTFIWSWSARSATDSKCPLPVIDNNFKFSLGISVVQMSQTSVMSTLAYAKFKMLSSEEMVTTSTIDTTDVILSPQQTSGDAITWVLVLSILLPVCVFVLVVSVILYRRYRQIHQQVSVVKQMEIEKKTDNYQTNPVLSPPPSHMIIVNNAETLQNQRACRPQV